MLVKSFNFREEVIYSTLAEVSISFAIFLALLGFLPFFLLFFEGLKFLPLSFRYLNGSSFLFHTSVY